VQKTTIKKHIVGTWEVDHVETEIDGVVSIDPKARFHEVYTFNGDRTGNGGYNIDSLSGPWHEIRLTWSNSKTDVEYTTEETYYGGGPYHFTYHYTIALDDQNKQIWQNIIKENGKSIIKRTILKR